ncbi:hypothetical protein C8R45DRAFT_1101984 [Mycena sanguinolenta]|nr:hypothetical protein C8R45DRAFT_1101984 [Mycena sanguinolenta]
MSLVPDRITPLTQAQFADYHGAVLASVMLPLFGLSIIQVYLYLLNYGNDSRWLKTFVAFLWTLGALNAILVCHTVYHYLVLSYTDPLLMIQGEWSVYTATAISILTCSLIEMFTSGKWRRLILVVNGILIPAQIVFGFLVTYKLFVLWDLPKLPTIVYSAMVPMFVLRVLTDAFTCVTLCIVLYEARPDYGRSLIKTLIVYAMNRFILTTQVSLSYLLPNPLQLLLSPDSIGAMVMEFVTGHLYINSFLATLNARASLRKGEVVDMNDSFKVAPRRTREDGVNIQITSETFILGDAGKASARSVGDNSSNTDKVYVV